MSKLCLPACAPEKELSIQVRHIDCIHVNDVYVAETGQGQVFQELTAKTTSTHAEYSTTIVQKLSYSRVWLKVWTCDVSRSVQEEVQILPPTRNIHFACSGQMRLRSVCPADDARHAKLAVAKGTIARVSKCKRRLYLESRY